MALDANGGQAKLGCLLLRVALDRQQVFFSELHGFTI